MGKEKQKRYKSLQWFRRNPRLFWWRIQGILMAQFDVYPNPSSNTRSIFPYILDIQNPLISDIAEKADAQILSVNGSIRPRTDTQYSSCRPPSRYAGMIKTGRRLPPTSFFERLLWAPGSNFSNRGKADAGKSMLAAKRKAARWWRHERPAVTSDSWNDTLLAPEIWISNNTHRKN